MCTNCKKCTKGVKKCTKGTTSKKENKYNNLLKLYKSIHKNLQQVYIRCTKVNKKVLITKLKKKIAKDFKYSHKVYKKVY